MKHSIGPFVWGSQFETTGTVHRERVDNNVKMTGMPEFTRSLVHRKPRASVFVVTSDDVGDV